ncbi:MAG: nuclear transport factor 2 family protein [Candidatus Baltobacteraceae bacterium]
MRALIDELVAAWKTNDAYRACAFFAPEAIYHESGRSQLEGRDAILEHFRRFFRDGPPWRFEVDSVVEEGDCAAVAYRFAVKGSSGEWQEREGCALVRCEGGLIVHWREYHG